MRTALGLLLLLWGCSSTAIGDDGAGGSAGNGSAGAPGDGGAGSDTPPPRPCSGALKQSLSLVDEVSTAAVSTVSESGGERIVYVDATAGGIEGQDRHPWVYVSLQTGEAVALTDLEALESKGWDLAFKRFLVRTNSGDSGPGEGGAIRIALDWDQVDGSTLGSKSLPAEDWFDADCMLEVDVNNELITSFTGWSEYDESAHVLNAAKVTYIAAAADGTLYKVAILDYYGTPAGKHGTVAGHYLVRIAPLT